MKGERETARKSLGARSKESTIESGLSPQCFKPTMLGLIEGRRVRQ